MKIVFIFSVYILIAKVDAFGGFDEPDILHEQNLYEAILEGYYNNAQRRAAALIRSSKTNVVQNVVIKLIDEGNRNVFDFAYRLWENATQGQNIVNVGFPAQFKLIFAQKLVKLINVRDNLALKLGGATDELGDRTAYGDGTDSTSENIAWKFIPEWDEGRVYFKIYGIHRRQYLKLGVKVDAGNDHSAYGDNHSATRRHEWYLKATYHEDKLVFYIFNRQYNQGLKLGRAVDYAGDRQAYSHSEEIEGEPELFAWHILSFY